MVTNVIIILLVVTICFYAKYQIAKNAPQGWEDEDGFHYGEKPKDTK